MEQRRTINKKIDGLSRKEPDSSKEEIFDDLERQKNKFTSFWVVLILLLVAIFSLMIFSAVKLSRIKITEKKEKSSDINLVSFSERVETLRGFGLSTMVFTGEEFAKAVGSDEETFPLKNVQFQISKDDIFLTGKLKDSLIPLSVKLKIIAAAADRKFTFIIEPNSIDNIIIYGENKEKIESDFDKNINKILEENNMIASGIEKSDDRLELKVVKEKE